MLATLIEVVDQGNRWFFSANSKRGTPPPKAIHIPRPERESEPEPKEQSTPEQVKAFMGRKAK